MDAPLLRTKMTLTSANGSVISRATLLEVARQQYGQVRAHVLEE